MDSTETNQLPQPEDFGPARPSTSEKLTYSVAEAASLLGVSRASIYRLMSRHVLRPIPGLRHKRLPKKQVRRLANGDTDAGSF